MNSFIIRITLKSLFTSLFILTTTNVLNAQNQYPPERVVVVASFERGYPKSIEVSATDLGIKTQVVKLLELKDSSFEMVNPTINKRQGQGWYLQYEFESEGKIGLYREQLQERDGQLVITESRSAEMGMATNCEKLVFTDEEEHCKCVDKKIPFFQTEVTHRLFFTIQ